MLSTLLTAYLGIRAFFLLLVCQIWLVLFCNQILAESAEQIFVFILLSALINGKRGMSIADRLKQARADMKLKQEEIVAISGIPLDTYRKYEGGRSEPGAKALSGLAKAGIDLNWLITGTRYTTDQTGKKYFEVPQIYEYQQTPAPPASKINSVVTPPVNPVGTAINIDALVQAICVSVQTAPRGETLAQSARKAVTFYQYCLERGMITTDGEGTGDLSEAI